jgi:hypothetical protein
MKRTLFALGILVGALTIATAPAQIVYSFETRRPARLRGQ